MSRSKNKPVAVAKPVEKAGRVGVASAVAVSPAVVVPNLGLVCITADERYRFRSTTLKRVMSLSDVEAELLLTSLYWENVQRLHAMLGYLDRVGIRLYRISSAIFPMSDLAVGERALATMRHAMSSVGRRAEQLKIRMVIHPDQFVVLNSPNEKTRVTSRLILEKHGRNLDWLGLPRSSWTAMNIHGGYAGIGLLPTEAKVGGPKAKVTAEARAAAKAARLVEEEKARAVRKRELMDTLCREIETLPEEVRSRLTLENDEHGYSSGEILEVCKRTGVPMVFDNLHHAVHEGLADYADSSFQRAIDASRQTWANPAWHMVHLSNGAASITDRYHSGFITQFPPGYRQMPWIEVEARGKERAIFHLRETWSMSEAERVARVPKDAIAEADSE